MNEATLLKEQDLTGNKEVLCFKEAAAYISCSPSYLYKLTSSSRIPCYKPLGKKLFFKRTELNDWLLRNRLSTIDELQSKAGDLVYSNKFRTNK